MKLATLKMIENLLQAEIEGAEVLCKKVNERIQEMYQHEANEPENFNQEELDYWKGCKKRRYARLQESKDALSDFLDHDWN